MSEDQRVFTREIPLELAEGDGRTLEGRIVPYGAVATVSDGGPAYRETFLPGAFAPQLKAANRVDVLLNFEHQQSIGDVVGRGTALRESHDGLYGTFRMLDHGDGDKALELVNAGVLGGLSIEFVDVRSRTVDGVVQRQSARVKNVALCRLSRAAYPDAKVLAVRTTDDEDDEDPAEPIVVPSLLPPSFDRLTKFGIAQPRWSIRREEPSTEEGTIHR